MDRDYTPEATALFSAFAARHGLTYTVETDVPVEVMWTFPVQAKLSLPLTLGLQNCDELNFGVADFWSYFFPFETVVAEFERVLDAWVEGNARVLVTGRRGRVLQVLDDGRWSDVYHANRLWLWRFKGTPKQIVQNVPVAAG